MSMTDPNSQAPDPQSQQLEGISFDYSDPNNNPAPNQEEFPPGFDQNFLKNVAPEDRQAVSRYWKQINGGITKHIQSVHDQYKWVKDLGVEQDEIAQAIHLFNNLNQDPVRVSQMLIEAAKEMYPDQFNQNPDDGDQGNEPEVSNLPEFDGVPKEFLDRFGKVEEFLQVLGQNYIDDRERAKQAEEDRLLDQTLDQLDTKYGPLDRDYVLLQMSKGNDPDSAAKAFLEFRDNLINSRTRKPPPQVLPGGASLLPGGQVSGSSKMDSKARKELIASVLNASNNG